MKKAAKRLVDSVLVPLCTYVVEKLPPRPVLPPRQNPEIALDDARQRAAARMPGNPCLKGFKVLVCCNLCGVNAFFVRKDLADGFQVVDCRDLFQPFREHLTALISEHRPSLRWLRDKLCAPPGSAIPAVPGQSR
jgi:hypothetical protein